MTPEERARAAAAAAAARFAQQAAAGPRAPTGAPGGAAPAATSAAPAAVAAAPAGGGGAGGKPDDAAVAAAWKEHTAPDGRKYYHNRLLKESRWTMPPEMKALQEAKGAGCGGRGGLVRQQGLCASSMGLAVVCPDARRPRIPPRSGAHGRAGGGALPGRGGGALAAAAAAARAAGGGGAGDLCHKGAAWGGGGLAGGWGAAGRQGLRRQGPARRGRSRRAGRARASACVYCSYPARTYPPTHPRRRRRATRSRSCWRRRAWAAMTRGTARCGGWSTTRGTTRSSRSASARRCSTNTCRCGARGGAAAGPRFWGVMKAGGGRQLQGASRAPAAQRPPAPPAISQARRNEERDAARRRAAEAKEAFSVMLDECGSLRPGDRCARGGPRRLGHGGSRGRACSGRWVQPLPAPSQLKPLSDAAPAPAPRSYRTARALLQDDSRWGVRNPGGLGDEPGAQAQHGGRPPTAAAAPTRVSPSTHHRSPPRSRSHTQHTLPPLPSCPSSRPSPTSQRARSCLSPSCARLLQRRRSGSARSGASARRRTGGGARARPRQCGLGKPPGCRALPSGCPRSEARRARRAPAHSPPPPRPALARELLRGAGLKASSQWRKIAPRLEGDPAFDELDKPERLRLFQVGGRG
jgi:hypothetical protein